jgi:hypothetical protein
LKSCSTTICARSASTPTSRSRPNLRGDDPPGGYRDGARQRRSGLRLGAVRMVMPGGQDRQLRTDVRLIIAKVLHSVRRKAPRLAFVLYGGGRRPAASDNPASRKSWISEIRLC